MKISVKCDYAVRCLLDLALHPEEKSVHIETISTRQGIPLKFLQSIILTLKKGGFVDSKKGPGGGYTLRRKVKDIKVGDVIRYVEGGLDLLRSTEDGYRPKPEERPVQRVAGNVWRRIEKAIADTADSITLSDLVDEHEKLTRSGGEHMFYI